MAIDINYEALPYQFDFDQSVKMYDMLFGGYGSGKTWALVMKLLKLAAINKGLPGGVLSPTTKMFKRDVLPTFEEICENAGMSMRYLPGDGVIRIPALNAKLWVFHGEDDGRSIRGPNLAYGGVNEITLISEKTFKAFIGRIRLKAAALRQIAGSGTPEGFNWTYDMFVADPRPDADVFYGDMRMNTYVAEEYAQMLVDAYDDIMRQQFVEGKFINTTSGSALYKFNRMKHTGSVAFNPQADVWASVDFNVAPLAATLWNHYPNEDVPLRAYDEIAIKDGDTYSLCRAIREKTLGARKVVIFPDPQGNQRRTSSKDLITDIEIMEQAGFDDIRYNKKISVRSCLNSANAFLNKNMCVLDRERCRETIKDFEQVTLKPGTNELEKKNIARTHWLDGFKNMIEHEYPITVGAGSWRQMQIR